MNKRKVIAYAIIASLFGVFGVSAWLASEGRYLEAISFVGVATTMAWFATRMIAPSSDD